MTAVMSHRGPDQPGDRKRAATVCDVCQTLFPCCFYRLHTKSTSVAPPCFSCDDSNQYLHTSAAFRDGDYVSRGPVDVKMTSSNDEIVLITGGSGFLGRAVLQKVRAGRLLAPSHTELDLLRTEDVEHYLSRQKVRRIIHAAGFVGGIGLHKEHPGRMIADNLRMGLNVLESAARNGVEQVVIVSTVCVYPGNAMVPTPETEIFHGMPADDTAGYGIAKRTLLTLAEGLHAEFGLQYTYVIPTNMYGPGDYFEESRSHVVSALLRRAMMARDKGGREMVVWGDGRSTRDFVFVDDVAMAIVACLQTKAYCQVFNVGSGREVSIQELAEMICDIVGFKGELRWDTEKPNGARRRALDTTRLKQVLGMEMKTGLREGLQATVQWMEENRVVAAR